MEASNLTLNGIKSLEEENSKQIKQSLILQIINVDKKDSADFKKVDLSDGFAKCSANLVLKDNPQVNDKDKQIIKVTEWEKKTKLIVIYKYAILKSNVSSDIGNPIDFELYKQQNYKNEKGDNKIQVQSNSNQMEVQYNQVEEQKKTDSSKLNQAQNQLQKMEIDEQSRQFNTIQELYPMINGFQLKARVIQKQGLRDFTQKNGTKGKMFSIDIIDKSNTEITCLFYSEAADHFFNKIEEGKVYVFQEGQNNSNQIVFDMKAKIEETQDDLQIKSLNFKFVPIDKIKDEQVNKLIDVIGIIQDNTISNVMKLKTGDQKTKRTFYIFDQSQYKIEITVWGEVADRKDLVKNNVVALKQVKVSEFNGIRTLTYSFQSQIYVNPTELEDYQKLRQFFSDPALENFRAKFLGDEEQKQAIYKDISEVEEEGNKLSGDKKLYNNIKCTVNLIKTTGALYYISCPNQSCQKKVEKIQGQENKYNCPSCHVVENAKARYVTTIRVVDSTGSIWLSIYDQIGQQLFGHSAEEIRQLVESQNDKLAKELLNENLYKEFKIKIITKMENYQGAYKPKHQIMKIMSDDLDVDCKDYISSIQHYLDMEN